MKIFQHRHLIVVAALGAIASLFYFLPDRGNLPFELSERLGSRKHLDPAVPGTRGSVSLENSLLVLMELLQGDRSREDIISALRKMERALCDNPREVATGALISFLESGADIPTRIAFKIGQDGDLAGAPTLRVWILDQLARLDPEAAANYSLRIYGRHVSADEWAVALRNDWRVAASSGRIEPVRDRLLELLSNEEWARRPSSGFLESFDIGVATMAWEAVPRFEQWLASESSGELRGAAWVALDKLTMEAPSDFIPNLVARREWLATQPLLRAGLVARADVSIDRQRFAVEAYLQRGDVSAEEGRRFFELFPNVSATIAQNLATASRAISPAYAARLDASALAAVREWSGQSRYDRWRMDLRKAEGRISDSVASAKRGGYLSQ